MDQAERFSELVGEIYDAALDPWLWTGVVQMRSVDSNGERLRHVHRVDGYPTHSEVGVFSRYNSNSRRSSLVFALSQCGAAELVPYLSRTMPAAEGHPAAVVSGIADPDGRLRG